MDASQIGDLYHEAILDHSRSPRNHRRIEHPTVSGQATNPFCGDEIYLQLKLHDGFAIAAQAAGCSINRASASMLTEVLQGKTPKDIVELSVLFRAALVGSGGLVGTPFEDTDLPALMGVRKFPVRIKCALLSWTTLEKTLKNYQRQEQEYIVTDERSY